jgi:hypothetical protein
VTVTGRECVEFARDCVQLADVAEDPDVTSWLLQLARHWIEAATVGDRTPAPKPTIMDPSRLAGAKATAIKVPHNESFAPEDVAALVTAYEDVLRTLGLTDRNDPVTVLVAKTIIEIAKSGDRNPQHLHLEAVNRLSK